MKKQPQTEVPAELLEDAVKSVESHEPAKAEEEKVPAETPPKMPAADSDLQDRYLRLAADYDNFRKRVQKEKFEYVRYASENLVKELLPVIDNFERALLHSENTPSDDPVVQGVKLIFSQLQSTLSRFGIRSESAQGKPFDPLTHDAVSQVYSKDVPANHVLQEHQKAYFLHDRLIRPAMVTVSKGAEPSPNEDKSSPSIH